MNILIFSQHFPPETVATGRRAHELAESLASRGHRVTVITGRPNHPSSLGRFFCRQAPDDECRAGSYYIVRVPVFRSTDPRWFKRLLNYATFMLAAAWKGVWQARPDAILAISPLPTGLAALMAHWRHRAPLVFDLQDVWPDSALAVGVMRESWAARALRCLERFFYGRCAAIVVISEGFKRYLLGLGVPPERVKVIPNGVDWERFAGARPEKRISRARLFTGRFVVGYLGNVGLAQGLDTLLNAAEHLRNEPVSFLFIGEGVDKQRLRHQVHLRKLANVRFMGGVPRRRVPALVAVCDALLVILRDDPLFKITIPSKLYEYMAAGRPVLCSVGGEAAALVSENKCGLATAPGDGYALATGIQKLLRNPALCRELGEAGVHWARTRFSLSDSMNAYAGLVEALPVNGRHQRTAPGWPPLADVR